MFHLLLESFLTMQHHVTHIQLRREGFDVNFNHFIPLEEMSDEEGEAQSSGIIPLISLIFLSVYLPAAPQLCAHELVCILGMSSSNMYYLLTSCESFIR